jgi:hypothetical protein
MQTYDVLHVAPGLDCVYWLLIKAHRDRRDALARDLQRLAALAETQDSPNRGRSIPAAADHDAGNW